MADLPTEHPEKLTTLGNQALVLDKLGDVDGAERIQVEVLESYRKIVDEFDPRRLAAKHNLANSYRARAERTGDAELAERAMGMYQEIIDVGDAASNSPDNAYAVINAKSNLALMLRREGKLAEAETLYKDVIDELNSNNDPVVHRYRLGLADVYSAMGRATDDQKLLSKAKKICQDVLAPGVWRKGHRAPGRNAHLCQDNSGGHLRKRRRPSRGHADGARSNRRNQRPGRSRTGGANHQSNAPNDDGTRRLDAPQ